MKNLKFWNWALFLSTHDQVNASPITKITIWFKFLGKTLHLVGCATLCKRSEVMLLYVGTGFLKTSFNKCYKNNLFRVLLLATFDWFLYGQTSLTLVKCILAQDQIVIDIFCRRLNIKVIRKRGCICGLLNLFSF